MAKRFKSMVDAEQAYLRADHLAVHRYRALRAVLLNEMIWLKVAGLKSLELNRVGLFDLQSPAGPKLLFVQDEGTSLNLTIHDAHEWLNKDLYPLSGPALEAADRLRQTIRKTLSKPG